MVLEARRIRMYASYYQFLVEDAGHPGITSDPNFWTREAFDDRLAIIPGTIGIGTASYDFVDVVVEIHDSPPLLTTAEWGHVTEADLELSSGTLRVAGCLDSIEDPQETFMVARGRYRVRCCHANLAAATDGTDDRTPGDWYLLQLWPSQKPAAPEVLKRAPARR